MTSPFVHTIRAALAAFSSRVAFEPLSHAYALDGRPVPSVTRILRAFFPPDFGQVSAAVLERKRQIGHAAHHATHLWDLGILDEASVAPEVAGYVASWQQFVTEYGVQVIATEVRLAHPTYAFAGTLDKVALVAASAMPNAVTLIDLKTGDPKAARTHLQTAGYEELLRAAVPPPFLVQRVGAQLGPDGGRARFTPYPHRADRRRFLALREALTIIHEESPHAASAVA